MQIIMNSWVANKAWLSHMQGVCPQCGARLSSTKQRSMIERKLQTIYLDLSSDPLLQISQSIQL